MSNHFWKPSGLLLLTALAGGCTQEQPRPVLKAEERSTMTADSLYMARLYEKWSQSSGKRGMPMDFADDVQYRFVMERVKAAGNTPENSPRLFARLSQQRTQALARGTHSAASLEEEWCGHLMDLQGVDSPEGEGQFLAAGLMTCFGGADYSYVDVTAYSTTPDYTDFTLLDSAVSDGYGLKVLETEPLDLNVSPGIDRVVYVDSVAMAYDEATEKSVSLYGAAEATALVVPSSPPKIIFEHPTEIIDDSAPGTVIRTCLERGSATGNLDCDYASASRNATTGVITPFKSGYTGLVAINKTASLTQSKWIPEAADYWAPSSPYSTSKLYLPARGTYQTGIPTDCTLDSITGSADIILLGTGGRCKAGTQSNTTVATGQLPWKNVSAPTEATFDGLIDFGSDCLAHEQDVRIKAQAKTVAYCPSPGGGAPTRVSKVSPLFNKSPLDFKNSCLAAGTRVQLAGGATLPVERVKVGDKLLSNALGRALTVTTVSHGTESKPMVRLRDAKGRQLLVTSKHPMLTRTQGVVAAERLVVGDVVLTREGEVKLTSVERPTYKGLVYNFTLGTDQELENVGNQERTLYANGFLVGDNKMQTDLARQSQQKSTDVLAHLHPSWRTDYLNDQSRRGTRR